MRLALADIPLEARADAARKLVLDGILEPLDALLTAVWPAGSFELEHEDVITGNDRCVNGHRWEPSNTYYHPTTGCRVCRRCKADANRRLRRRRLYGGPIR